MIQTAPSPLLRQPRVVFDEAQHIYWHPESKIPYSGVTTILKAMAANWKAWWTVGEMAKALGVFKDDNEKVAWKKPRYIGGTLKPGEALTEQQIVQVVSDARKAHMKSSDKAKGTGTDVHALIATHIQARIAGKEPETFGTLDAASDNCLKAFLSWEREQKPIYLLSEQPVCSEEVWYAGTLDTWAVIGGKRDLLDFKTSAGIYEEQFIQLSAYHRALSECIEGDPGGRAVVRLPKDGKPYEFVHAPFAQDADFGVFQACLTIHRWQATCEARREAGAA